MSAVGASGWAVAIYVLIAGLLGGGGSPSPLPEMILQASGIVLMAWVVAGAGKARKPSRRLVAVALAVALLPLLQLVPLPPSLWTALPGRDLLAASLGLIASDEPWHALSIAPWSTLASLLAMVPPLAVLVAASVLTAAERTLVLSAVVLTAIIGALLGAGQLAGIEAAYPYAQTHRGSLVGLFASRNAMADHLLIALLVLPIVAAGVGLRRWTVPASVSVGLLFLTALVLTGSRAGLLLLAPVLLALTFLVPSRPTAQNGIRPVFIFAPVAVVAAAILWFASGRSAVVDRFVTDPVGRAQLWSDGWAAIAHYWPLGSGLGTFRQAYLPFEERSALDYSTPNRMHNDYLELALEAGLPGLVLLAAIAVTVAVAAVRRYRAIPDLRRETIFAAMVLVVVALHAIVDYPLRTMALSTFVAFATGVLFNANGVVRKVEHNA